MPAGGQSRPAPPGPPRHARSSRPELTLKRSGAARRTGSSRLRTPSQTTAAAAAEQQQAQRPRRCARLASQHVQARAQLTRRVEAEGPQPLPPRSITPDRFQSDDGVAHEHLLGFAQVPPADAALDRREAASSPAVSKIQRRMTPATPQRSSSGVIRFGSASQEQVGHRTADDVLGPRPASIPPKCAHHAIRRAPPPTPGD